jgi:hypothetical protein
LTADEPHEVLQWLTRESDAGNRGWYVLIENRLTFERPTPTGSIRREGSALTVDNRHALDSRGRRVAVTTTVKVHASDPDGDPLTFLWRASNGSISASDSTVVRRDRPVSSYGAVDEGVLFLEVRDAGDHASPSRS